MKHHFREGDFIEILNSCKFKRGTTAEVLRVTGENLSVRIDMDKPMDDCHSCKGLCEKGYGWTISYDKVRLLQPNKTEDFDVSENDLISLIGGAVCAG